MHLVRNAPIDSRVVGCASGRESGRDMGLPPTARRSRSAAGPARILAICAIMGSVDWKVLGKHWEGRTWGAIYAAGG